MSGVRIPTDSEFDTESTRLVRLKFATKGWSYQARSVELATSTLNSEYCKKPDLTDWGDVTLKLYDSGDNEITDQPTADISCVKTVLDWEPAYDYEIIGGSVSIKVTPLNDIRVWCVAVPDIPEGSGGSKVMINGINLIYKNIKEEMIIDGRTSKRMTYHPTYHTNKLRMILRHNAGAKSDIQIIWEHYKQ